MGLEWILGLLQPGFVGWAPLLHKTTLTTAFEYFLSTRFHVSLSSEFYYIISPKCTLIFSISRHLWIFVLICFRVSPCWQREIDIPFLLVHFLTLVGRKCVQPDHFWAHFTHRRLLSLSSGSVFRYFIVLRFYLTEVHCNFSIFRQPWIQVRIFTARRYA